MKKTLIASAIGAALVLGACSEQATDKKAETVAAAPEQAVKSEAPVAAETQMSNPLFVKSPLQYQAPQFDKIKTEHFAPAFEQGMKEHLAEIEAIANNAEAPTFENTIEAMETSGELLNRAVNTFFNLTGTISDEAIRAVQSDVAPKLSAHQDAINLNGKLFERIEALYAKLDQFEGEQKRLVENYYKGFVRSGAKLTEAQKDQIRDINGKLAKLTNDFSQNVLKATKDAAVLVEDKTQLAGLSESDISALSAAAEAAGHKGKYLITLVNTTRQPILASLQSRELREQVWTASANRGAELNGPVIKEITTLRAQKAKLMGYDSWADYVLEENMAKTPGAVLSMLDDLAPKVVEKANAEAADIQALIKAQGGDFELKPWDWIYYAEQVRAKKFDLDEQQIRPYFELNNVLENGVFFAMNQLFGISFKERHDLPVYHPDVRTFEVFDDKGESIGFFYGDYFARDGKRGGAWMNAMVGQSHLLGQKPVIVNVMNIPKPAEGQPALVSFDNANTMFHEMGHAVHGLFSDVKYPSLAGTAVPRDFVEFPSQFEEDWSINPKVIANYAKHYETGEPIPAELLDKLLKSRQFNQGFDSLEYLGSALLDMEWHMIGADAKVEDVQAFEDKALEKHGLKHGLIPPRYKSNYFSHTFAGGYSAGYYAYIWTEVLAADAFAHMKSNGGLTRENGDKFRKEILSRGDTLDQMEQYINFKGEKPSVDALLKRRGLVE
ncbi:M3 family metallopeptidase [Gallaecimonas sp. GXIMD4217]|uniref:M3 family metallopeptidase n=1 Tax=Gallaecimonas sp. GXIMD4217 TaxID=3131927 RepID=UPI00311B3481